MLWLSWPKARKSGSDLGLSKVIEIGYKNGLVESTCCGSTTPGLV